MLDFFLSYFLVYPYWLFFGVTLLAAFGIPLPATAIIIAGGAFCSQGYLDISWLFLAGFVGCVIGDISGYSLSFLYGESFFRTLGLKKMLSSRYFLNFKPFFQRHALVSIFLSRFLITGIGPSINILSGITKIIPLHFVSIDIIGEATYIALYIAIGYSFGTQWESILSIVESFSTLLISLCLIILVIWIIWNAHEKEHRKI